MQSAPLRMARLSARVAGQQQQRRVAVGASRCLATTASPAATHADAPTASAAASRSVAPVPLFNVEAQWAKLSNEEKSAVHEQIEVLQKKDWKELSIDEKKAAYYLAFGPHGPRTPDSKPGDGLKIILGVTAALAAAAAITVSLRSFAAPPPKTLTKEWEEAANERALEMKLNPISGISSEGYSGKGFVQSK